jgi:hypothetical protein
MSAFDATPPAQGGAAKFGNFDRSDTPFLALPAGEELIAAREVSATQILRNSVHCNTYCRTCGPLEPEARLPIWQMWNASLNS